MSVYFILFLLFYLEVGAEGGQHDAVAGELEPPATQGHVAERAVVPQAVEALQDGAGVPAVSKHVVIRVGSHTWEIQHTCEIRVLLHLGRCRCNTRAN